MHTAALGGVDAQAVREVLSWMDDTTKNAAVNQLSKARGNLSTNNVENVSPQCLMMGKQPGLSWRCATLWLCLCVADLQQQCLLQKPV